MSKKQQAINPLVPLGIGIGIGVCTLFAAIELLPFLVIGGAGYMIYKGINNTNTEETNDTCSTGQEKK